MVIETGIDDDYEVVQCDVLVNKSQGRLGAPEDSKTIFIYLYRGTGAGLTGESHHLICGN